MKDSCNRRDFMKRAMAGGAAAAFLGGCTAGAVRAVRRRPNLLYILADQWRAQAVGYAGNREVVTPHLDRLAKRSVNYAMAVSNCPVCSPYRASLLTGQYPLTHGLYLNDLQLNREATSFAQAYRGAGYHTGYIGKWHLDGSGRSTYIPPERRQGFEYWKVLECTHNYNRSAYYAGNDPTRRVWAGYDAYAQTDDAIGYLGQRAKDGKPFALFLSWGSPHAPYRTGPKALVERYDKQKLAVRDNVPPEERQAFQKDTAGYYAHIEALDQCVGKLVGHLEATGLDQNTIVVFTSDHGDMLHSRGMMKKQRPWDESIRVPFLLCCPRSWQVEAKVIDVPISTPDIMPTVLGLSGIDIPETCEGENLSQEVLGQQAAPEDRGALILCPSPFGQWTRKSGGREYRGIRTKRYTYVRDIKGPWLLYDNLKDPYQQKNLLDEPGYEELVKKLKRQLDDLLAQTGDRFLSGPELIARCGYKVDSSGTVAYQNPAYWGQVSRACRD